MDILRVSKCEIKFRKYENRSNIDSNETADSNKILPLVFLYKPTDEFTSKSPYLKKL